MKEFFDRHYFLIIYTLFFAGSLVFTFLMNSLFLRFFHTLGIRNRNDGTIIRWGSSSKPSVGGLSFYIMFLLSLASYSIFFNPNDALYNSRFMGFILAMAIGFLLGLADDAYDTNPLLKFLAQVACAGCLIFTGTFINISSSTWFNYLFTVFWVVGIMNSVNMLDNMDGITASVSCGVIVSAIVVIISNGDYNNLFLIALIGVLASIVGFLYFNWHPSKMYMGDTGSQFLGIFLASLGIIYFWNDNYHPLNIHAEKRFVITLIAFILPIIDTTVVVTNRLLKGKSPFIGGKDHTTHSLAYLGLKDNQVGWVYVCMSCVSIIMVLIIDKLITQWTDIYTFIFLGYFLALLVFFFYISRRIKPKRQTHAQPATSSLEPSHS